MTYLRLWLAAQDLLIKLFRWLRSRVTVWRHTATQKHQWWGKFSSHYHLSSKRSSLNNLQILAIPTLPAYIYLLIGTLSDHHSALYSNAAFRLRKQPASLSLSSFFTVADGRLSTPPVPSCSSHIFRFFSRSELWTAWWSRNVKLNLYVGPL